MVTTIRAALCLAVLAAGANFVHAGVIAVDPAAKVTMWADGTPYEVPLTPYNDHGYTEYWIGDYYNAATESYEYRFDKVDENGNPTWSCVITGELDPDPSISYGISVTDFGAPSEFSFSFTTPIILAVGPTIVRGSIVGGLTDRTGNGVSITPGAAAVDSDGDGFLEIQTAEVSGPATNMGVDVGLSQVHPAGPSGSLYTYGAYAAGWQPGPPQGTFGTLTTTTTFRLSGGSDIASLTGSAFIEPIPEPSTLALAALGLAGLAIRYRRRSK